ncbi:ferritin family protein [Chloroflexota bacterium]
MSIAFSGNELINIAIGIEKRGITFYDIMARSTDNDMAREMFQNLADMERGHVQLFQDMLDESDKYQPDMTLTEEYNDYLKSLIDNAVFTDDMITSEMATQANSDVQSVELGISAEKDSILFYYQMRDMMPRQALPKIDGIIAEEKSHLRQLSEIKKRLTEVR